MLKRNSVQFNQDSFCKITYNGVLCDICLNCSENFESLLFMDNSNNWKCAKEMVVLVLGTMNYSLLYLAHLYHTSLFFTRQNMQYSTKPEKFGQFPFFAIVQRKKVELWHAAVLYGIFCSVDVLFWRAVFS